MSEPHAFEPERISTATVSPPEAETVVGYRCKHCGNPASTHKKITVEFGAEAKELSDEDKQDLVDRLESEGFDVDVAR